MENVRKPRFASVWLGGCSGCHMSFLDVDEWLIELTSLVDIVYGPFVDIKDFPEDVDITLVEGAVANEDNVEVLRTVRKNSKIVIAFGDCAVTGNVTAMRNPIGTALEVLQNVYVTSPDQGGQLPNRQNIVPVLLDRVLPAHELVKIDAYLHGCPPSGPNIRKALEEILAGNLELLNSEPLKFG